MNPAWGTSDCFQALGCQEMLASDFQMTKPDYKVETKWTTNRAIRGSLAESFSRCSMDRWIDVLWWWWWCWWWCWYSKCSYYSRQGRLLLLLLQAAPDARNPHLSKVVPSHLLLFSRHHWYFHKCTTPNYILLSVSISMFTLGVAAIRVSHCPLNFWCGRNS